MQISSPVTVAGQWRNYTAFPKMDRSINFQTAKVSYLIPMIDNLFSFKQLGEKHTLEPVFLLSGALLLFGLAHPE